MAGFTYEGALAFMIGMLVVFLCSTALRFWVLRHQQRSRAFLVSDFCILLYISQGLGMWVMAAYQVISLHKASLVLSAEGLTNFLYSAHNMKIYYSEACLFVSAIWTMKACFLSLYCSFAKVLSPVWRILLYNTIALVVVTFIVNFALYVGWCQPVYLNWTDVSRISCHPATINRGIITCLYVTDLVTNLLILVFPIGLVRNIRLARRESLGLFFVWFCGLLTMTVTALRFSLMMRLVNDESQRYLYVTYQQYLGITEIVVANFAFCLPSFRHFVKRPPEWMKRILTARTSLSIAWDHQENDDSDNKQMLGISVTREFDVQVTEVGSGVSGLYALGLCNLNGNFWARNPFALQENATISRFDEGLDADMGRGHQLADVHPHREY